MLIFLFNCAFDWPQIKKQTHKRICIITIIIRRIHNHLLPLEGGILTSKPLKQRTNVPIALPFPHPLNFIDFSLFSIVLAIVNALYINVSPFLTHLFFAISSKFAHFSLLPQQLYDHSPFIIIILSSNLLLSLCFFSF